MDIRSFVRLCQDQRRIPKLREFDLDKPPPRTDPVHVVAAVIWHPAIEGTFLISRRQEGKHLERYWELPGGKIERGEEVFSALTRELLEEVNIDVESAEPFMQVHHDYADISILLDVWQVSDFSGEAQGLEGQEIFWVSTGELDRFQFPEADEPVLEAIRSIGTAEKGYRP